MPGTLRSGIAAQWCAIDETTYGVVPSLAGAPFYVLKSDTLKLNKVPKQGAGIYAGALYPAAARRVVTQYSAGGGMTMELPERRLNQWLLRMFGSYGQTPATLTEDGSTGAFKAVHAPGPLEGFSFTVQKGAPTADNGTVVPVTYPGCKVSEWEISAGMGEIADLALTIEARNELAGSFTDPLNGSVPALLDFEAPPGSVFRWLGGTVFYGGTPSTTSGVTTLASPTVAGNIKGPISVKQTTPLDLERFAPDVAPFRNEPLQNNVRAVTGQFVVEWLSAETYLAAYQEDTATAIEYRFQTVPIGTGSDIATLSILVPNVRLEGESVQIPGPEVLTQTVPWTGLDDRVNNVIQATYVTLDAS